MSRFDIAQTWHLELSIQKDLYLDKMRFIVNSEGSKSHFKNESCHSKIAAHI